jgi:POLO box duplicated region
MDIVLKFAKVQDAIIFRLSTRCIQIIFEDNLSLISSEEGNVITLLDLGKGCKETFWLSALAASQFMHSDKIVKRLDWFKNHLGSFLQNYQKIDH